MKRKTKTKFKEYHQQAGFTDRVIKACHSKEALSKLSHTIKNKLLDDEDFRKEFDERTKKASYGTVNEYTGRNGNVSKFRSMYERRFAIILDTLEIE